MSSGNYLAALAGVAVIAFSIWVFLSAEARVAEFKKRAAQMYGDRVAQRFYGVFGVRLAAIGGVVVGGGLVYLNLTGAIA